MNSADSLPQLISITSESGQLVARSPYLAEHKPLLVLEQNSRPLAPRSITTNQAGFRLVYPGEQGDITIDLALHGSPRDFTWSVNLSAPGAQPRVYFPFLSTLSLGANSRRIDFSTLRTQDGQPALRARGGQVPLALTDGAQSLALYQEGGADSPLGWPENSASGISLPSNAEMPGYTGKLTLLPGGWRAAFDWFRQQVRAEYDLTEYRREDLRWYADQFVQHFTFLYGREILNLESGAFELERFLDEGERDFGGYDGFLIWGVYPRLGVDERTQWDFYDDLPGGRAGLREMALSARKRGARFFVPYKPWDRSAALHGQTTTPDEEQLAQLIVDTGADGVFLDTMEMITPAFRQAIDRRKPGVVFCSEGRARGPALEIVTGCWEQSPNRDGAGGNWSASREIMPQVDLWRFILPEHRLFVINRHTMGDDRVRIIQRGFFNGMGWVVWQDIFGLALPYSPSEAALLKKCRTIFREHREAVNCPAPTPLVATLAGGLWANEFPGETKRLWTLYNETGATISGPALAVEPRAGAHFFDVWNGCDLPAPQDGALSLEIAPRSLGCVVEYPRLLERAEDGTSVRASVPLDGAQLILAYPGGEQALLAGPGAGAWAELPGLPPGALIRLVRDGEVLDQTTARALQAGG